MDWNERPILVTGATGFLGGALAIRLANEGAQVKALARSPEKGAFLAPYKNIEIIQGDIRDRARMIEACQGCDTIFHAAAAIRGPMSLQRPANVEGSRNMAIAAAQAGVRRFVHISSISVYAYASRGAEISEETTPIPGKNPYSITKSEAEAILIETAAQYGLSYTIIRPGSIYGPRSTFWTGAIFKLARLRPLIFFGDGRGSAPIIYVDDLVDLCLIAAARPAADGQVFLAVNDPPPTFRQFLLAFAALAGHHTWIGIPLWLVIPPARLGAALAPLHSMVKVAPDYIRQTQHFTRFKMDKAAQLLGWQPQTDLAAGVQNCAPWLRSQGLLK